MSKSEVPFGVVAGRRFTLTHRGRHFEVWLSDEGDYLVIEYKAEYYDDGDAESGPSVRCDYVPEHVCSGYGLDPTERGIRDMLDHMIHDELAAGQYGE